MNRIDRLTAMILLLQSHRVITAEKIATHFGISVRTVYRDLSALGQAGVPIQAEAGTGYALMRGYHLPPVMFTEDEAAALFLGGEVATRIADDSLRQALRDALLKVRSVLTPDRRDYLNRLASSVSIHLPARTAQTDAGASLMPLQQAVVKCQCVALHYNAGSLGEITTRTVEPLAVIFYGQQWHLIAHCRLRGEIRDFRMDRMAGWQVLEQTFQPHQHFCLQDFIARASSLHHGIPVTLHFRAGVMDRVRQDFSSQQPLAESPLPDGWVRVDSHTLCMDWMARWILGYGPEARVITPDSLRQQVRDLALEIAASYTF